MAALASGLIAACGGRGPAIASKSPSEILRLSMRAAAAAQSVRITGTLPILGSTGTVDFVQTPYGAMGSLHEGGARIAFRIVRAVAFASVSAGAGAQFLGATIPRALRVGWVELGQPRAETVVVSSTRLFFGRLEGVASAGSFHKAGLVTVNGREALRLVDDEHGHIDVAATGRPFPLDLVVASEHAQLAFTSWNAPALVMPPAHWTTSAALRPRVRTVNPSLGTLLPSFVLHGRRRFRAAGIAVQFDYPASFVPLEVIHARRAGRLRGGADVAVGTPSGAAVVVTPFSGLPIPVTPQDASILTPQFQQAVSALAGRTIPVRTGEIDGHVLLAFSPYRSGGWTVRIFNVFVGDEMIEVRCQYTAAERPVGESACAEMRRTLTVGATGHGVV
jgi:hypothetical protein